MTLSLRPGHWLSYIALALLAIAAGIAVTGPQGRDILVVLVAVPALVMLVRQLGDGFVIGVLIMGAVDGLPGPNLELTRLPVGLYGTDGVLIALLAVLLYVNATQRFFALRTLRAARYLGLLCLALLLWWLFTLSRTVLGGGDPEISSAVYFGHDFLFFALLSPLFVQPFLNLRTRKVAIATLGVGAATAAVVQIGANFGHPVHLLLHQTSETVEFGSLSRVYTSTGEVLVLAFPMCLGELLLGRDRLSRSLAGALALLIGVALALTLTRALYVGAVVGFAGATSVWLFFADNAGRVARVRLVRAGAIIVCTVITLVAYQPAFLKSSAVNGITARVSSIFSTLTSEQTEVSTVAIREQADHELSQLLGSRWPVGLGFLNPKQHYVPELPEGSIRDSDTGLFNAVMTMGVVGAALIYAPVVLGLIAVLRYRLRAASHERAAELFGVLMWLLTTLASSLTLVTLFSVAGLVITSAVLGFAIALSNVSAPRSVDPRAQTRTAL